MNSLGLRREIKNIRDSVDVVSKDVTTKFADVFDELLILSTKIKIKDQKLDQVERELGLMKQDTEEMKKQTQEMKKQTEEMRKERKEMEKKIKIEAEKREKQHYEDLKKEFISLRGYHDFVRGGIIEKIYIANIISLYAAKQWKIHTILSNHHVIDGNNRTLTEIDVLSINDNFVLVTEVKLQLTNDRVDRFVAKLPIIKAYLVRRGIHQPVYGAVAAIQDYFIVEDQSDKYLKRFQPPPKYNQQLLNSKSISALKYAETRHGLFTIELFGYTAKFSGETGAISFKPKVYEAAHEPSITV